MNVIVIGTSHPLLGGLVLPMGTPADFDNTTDTWTVIAPDGSSVQAEVVIDNRPSADDTVAVHGLPNFFRIPGPDIDRGTRYVARCVDLMRRCDARRMEARSRIRLRRWSFHRIASNFYLNGSAPDDEIYTGPARLTLADRDIDVTVRLTGHLDAVDGRYHWRGMLSGDLPPDILTRHRNAALTIGGQATAARVVEHTPWGSYTVSGVGAPPLTPA